MKMVRFLTLFGTMALLCGCATTQLIGMGITGVSYAVSGKSITDHVVSAVKQQDCAFHRMLFSKSACVPLRQTNRSNVMLASNSQSKSRLPFPNAKPVTSNRSIVNQQRVALNKTMIKRRPQRVAKINTSKGPQLQAAMPILANVEDKVIHSAELKRTKIVRSSLTDSSPKFPIEDNSTNFIEQPQTYVVIGSFNDIKFARERQINNSKYNAEVISNSAATSTKFRVVIGPFPRENFRQAFNQLPEFESMEPWPISLCSSTLSKPPCENSTLARVSP